MSETDSFEPPFAALGAGFALLFSYDEAKSQGSRCRRLVAWLVSEAQQRLSNCLQVRCCAKREHFAEVQGLQPEDQGQNRAVTVLYVPCSFDSKTRQRVSEARNLFSGAAAPLQLPPGLPQRTLADKG